MNLFNGESYTFRLLLLFRVVLLQSGTATEWYCSTFTYDWLSLFLERAVLLDLQGFPLSSRCPGSFEDIQIIDNKIRYPHFVLSMFFSPALAFSLFLGSR